MNSFNKDILIKLGNEHKKILELVKNNINNMKSNKELYKLIDNYLKENSINRAFPIGISINEIIAHDSYHIDNKILFKDGDLIKVDVGLEEDGNIIDSARTFEYKTNQNNKSIDDCREIVEKVEELVMAVLQRDETVAEAWYALAFVHRILHRPLLGISQCSFSFWLTFTNRLYLVMPWSPI